MKIQLLALPPVILMTLLLNTGGAFGRPDCGLGSDIPCVSPGQLFTASPECGGGGAVCIQEGAPDFDCKLQCLGIDSPGFSTEKAPVKCQLAVAKAVRKLTNGLLKCSAKGAKFALKSKSFDIGACEAEAKAKYDKGVTKTTSCPACLDPSILREGAGYMAAETLLAQIFCTIPFPCGNPTTNNPKFTCPGGACDPGEVCCQNIPTNGSFECGCEKLLPNQAPCPLPL